MKVRKVDFSPDEFLVGVAGMKAADIGVYWVACALEMSSGKAIAAEDERLFSIIDGRRPDIKASLDRLKTRGKLKQTGDELSNKRASTEVKRAAKRIRTAQINGVNGGRPPRKNKEVGNPGGIEPGSGDGKLPPPLTPPPPIEDTPIAPKGAGSYSKEFEAFWEAYPHKVAKDAAWKRWETLRKAHKLPTLEILIEAVKAYEAGVATAREKRPDHPYANPATWLNGGRWKDAPADVKPADGTAVVNEPPADVKGWRAVAWREIGGSLFKTWIEAGDFRRNMGTVTAHYRTKFQVDWVRSHYADNLLRWMKAEDAGVQRVVIDLVARETLGPRDEHGGDGIMGEKGAAA